MCYSHLEKHCHSSVTMCVCVCVCLCVCVRACVRVCGRACVRVHVMYVTTTTHKYNVTIEKCYNWFSHVLIQTMSCSCIRAANCNLYDITTRHSHLHRAVHVRACLRQQLQTPEHDFFASTFDRPVLCTLQQLQGLLSTQE